jgi:hypothetical protein
LRQFIDHIGIPKISRLLDVHQATVYYWRQGHVLPKPEQMLALKKISHGDISIDQMVEDYFSNPKNKRKFSCLKK